jgi:fructose-1-phosphate kinase PfkB-like protein
MREYLKNEYRLVQSYHTLAAAGTRENITVLDRRGFREMHLRNKNELADTGAVKKLQKDLEKLLKKDDVCVFSGSISEGIIEEIYKILALCRQAGAKIVLDTSGDALVKLAGCGLIDIVKPNIQEFEQITGEKFDTGSLLNDKTKLENIKAGRILISCGADGAVMICGEERFKCRVKDSKEVLSTVACGDYFLAGYLWAAKQGFDEKRAVQCAVKAGTAKAWQMTDKFSWDEVLGKIETEIIA